MSVSNAGARRRGDVSVVHKGGATGSDSPKKRASGVSKSEDFLVSVRGTALRGNRESQVERVRGETWPVVGPRLHQSAPQVRERSGTGRRRFRSGLKTQVCGVLVAFGTASERRAVNRRSSSKTKQGLIET